jgi:hypothetical protein
MTTEHVTALTELERDALGEIANIAMGRAANSIRQMVGHHVLLSVPAVEILSKQLAAQVVGTPDNRILVAIRQDFTGAFSGRALLIFPETSGLELMRPELNEAFAIDGPAIVDCVVPADEMPNMPHIELDQIGNYAVAKIKEAIHAVTGG